MLMIRTPAIGIIFGHMLLKVDQLGMAWVTAPARHPSREWQACNIKVLAKASSTFYMKQLKKKWIMTWPSFVVAQMQETILAQLNKSLFHWFSLIRFYSKYQEGTK